MFTAAISMVLSALPLAGGFALGRRGNIIPVALNDLQQPVQCKVVMFDQLRNRTAAECCRVALNGQILGHEPSHYFVHGCLNRVAVRDRSFVVRSKLGRVDRAPLCVRFRRYNDHAIEIGSV